MQGQYYNDNSPAPNWSLVTPEIFNVTMTNADTEYSQALPKGCKRFYASVFDGESLDNYRLAYVIGKVATPTAPYLKYNCNIEYYEEGLNLDAVTLYFACSAAGKTMQILAWV